MSSILTVLLIVFLGTEGLAPNRLCCLQLRNLLWEHCPEEGGGGGNGDGPDGRKGGKAEQAFQHRMPLPQAPRSCPLGRLPLQPCNAQGPRAHRGREGLGICACANHSTRKGLLCLAQAKGSSSGGSFSSTWRGTPARRRGRSQS